jgi:hypothetical protein
VARRVALEALGGGHLGRWWVVGGGLGEDANTRDPIRRTAVLRDFVHKLDGVDGVAPRFFPLGHSYGIGLLTAIGTWIYGWPTHSLGLGNGKENRSGCFVLCGFDYGSSRSSFDHGLFWDTALRRGGCVGCASGRSLGVT